MTRIDAVSPELLAEQIQQTIDSPGWKLIMEQYDREVRRAEKWVVDIAGHAHATDQVAQELRYRQGFLRGAAEIRRWLVELRQELAKGRIPWER